MSEKIERRTMIKAMGALSIGITTFSSSNAEKLAEPIVASKKSISTDILVVGGGTAGTIAAIQAGRAGSKTVLIESGSQLGGTATTGGVTFPGIFHAWGKQIIAGIGWELVTDCVKLNGDRLPDFSIIPNNTTIRHWRHQVTINGALYTLLAEEKCLDAGVHIRYYETPSHIEFKKGKWVVETIGKGVSTQIICDQIIDCTGNAIITSMAGFNVLREAEIQPGSLVFRIGGYNFHELDLAKIPKEYHGFLRQNMLDPIKEDPVGSLPSKVPYGYVYVPDADSTTSEAHTHTNISGRSKLLGLLRTLKSFPGCENVKIVDLKTETAVRETYRIDGVYKITARDYLEGKLFEDSITHSFYPIDLHRKGKSIHQEFLKPGVVANIPLRALIPKRSRNFLVAGRCISSDRMANSALRVQAPCMGMGQAAAATAVLASKSGMTPAEVPLNDIRQLLEAHGAVVPSGRH